MRRNGVAGATLSALCATVCDEWNMGPPLSAPYDDVVGFVEDELERLAPHLRAPMAVLMWALSAHAVLRTARPFHRVPADARRPIVAAWRNASVGPLGDFIRLVESLSTVALFSRAAFAAQP